MKAELVKDGVVLELDHLGRQIFITEGESSTIRGFFDDDEAAAAFAVLVAEREASGWLPSPREQQKRDEAARLSRARDELQQRVRDAVADVDAARGARTLLPMLASVAAFDVVASAVVSVVALSDMHVQLTLRSGLHLEVSLAPAGVATTFEVLPWFVPLRGLSALRVDRDPNSDEPVFYFGAEAGPADDDLHLKKTAFADDAVEWFIEEEIAAPPAKRRRKRRARHWFFADGAAHCLEDKKVVEVFAGSLADLVVARLAAAIA